MSTSNKKRIPFILSFSVGCVVCLFVSRKWSDIIDNNQCRHGVLLTCFKQSNLVHQLGKYSWGSKIIDTCANKASFQLQAIDLLAFKLKLVLCLPKPCKRSMDFQCFWAGKEGNKVSSLYLKHILPLYMIPSTMSLQSSLPPQILGQGSHKVYFVVSRPSSIMSTGGTGELASL